MFINLRQALRSLTRSPGFFVLAVATLALGIAANTALFSVASSVLWRPLPFPEPERLVWLTEHDVKQDRGDHGVSAANFEDWRRRAQSFESLAAFAWPRSRTISGPGFAERIRVSAISDGYFETLRVPLSQGMTLKSDHPHSIVISDGFWRRVFDGASGVLGRRVKIDGEPYTVAGVLPGGFHHEVFEDPDVFLPPRRPSESGIEVAGSDRKAREQCH